MKISPSQPYHTEEQRFYREMAIRVASARNEMFSFAHEAFKSAVVSIPDPQIALEYGAFTIVSVDEDYYALPSFTLRPLGETSNRNDVRRINPLSLKIRLTDAELIAAIQSRLTRWQELPQRGTEVPAEIARLTAQLSTMKGQ